MRSPKTRINQVSVTGSMASCFAAMDKVSSVLSKRLASPSA